MNNLPTVSDTKRAFYNIHTRPVNSIYRRVVEELMVEMHLLRVNEDFQEDAIFALGVINTYDKFMDGYTPEQDQGPIFTAVCQALGTDPNHYRHQGDQILQVAQSQSKDDLLAWFTHASQQGGDDLQSQVHRIAGNTKFKYSRLFGIGLAALLNAADPELLKDSESLAEILKSLAEQLNLPTGKLQRDVEIYCSNLEKMAQTREAMADMVAAERKRKEKAEADKLAKEQAAQAGTAAPEASSNEASPPEEASSDAVSESENISS